MSKTKQARYEIAPRIRADFLKAIDEVARRKDKAFFEVMADWLEADPIAMFNAMAKFSVREKSIEIRGHFNSADEMPDDELKAAVAGILHRQEKGNAPITAVKGRRKLDS